MVAKHAEENYQQFVRDETIWPSVRGAIVRISVPKSVEIRKVSQFQSMN